MTDVHILFRTLATLASSLVRTLLRLAKRRGMPGAGPRAVCG